MGGVVNWIDSHYYPNIRSHWDDAVFREAILSHLRPDMQILDIGAGAGIVSQMNFKGLAKRVCGLDPDKRVIENPFLDEGKQGIGEFMPYPNNSFDLVFADNVLEHLEAPEKVFKEIARVLKHGGTFLGKTPNRRHYMPVIAQLTPFWFHRWINRKRGRKEIDTFPTRYRANTRRDLEFLAGIAGLTVDSIHLSEGRPEYLRFSGITYLIGLAYERLVNSFSLLAPFRIILIVAMKKPLQ